ncbi:hypothetical protein F2Q68_00015091 [Brassica cretica]|uniref:DUF4283 domain-containing protein n=1 Tax=Brassica cretica TaxID=69181 RepID=A0A8S9HSL2_BRACR|nr:hypothetical protein F2Q68_00015091 [Brassica cretica]
MPEQWGMSDKISAYDLGNGRFSFNFDNEEDLNSVVSQGHFHHNYCMFVLVRWETNLEAIGDRLGKLESTDRAEGRIKVTMDLTKPLKFTRKLQTRKKEDITIKLFYTVPLENVFYRVRPPRQDGPSRGNVERGKDETSYKSLNDGSSSTLRVQRSSHSSRVHRVNIREQVWKEKQQPLRTVEPAKKRMDMDTVRTYSSPKKNIGNRGKSVVAILDRSQKYKRDDMNVTYRDGTGSGKSTVEGGTADDLIPPYDALKIDALSEQEQDEEGQLVDADMQDAPVGNELMVLEEDDLLEEDLNQIENQELIELDRSQPLLASEHDNSILMIEAKEKTVDDDTREDYAKALTRSATRSLFSTSQASI